MSLNALDELIERLNDGDLVAAEKAFLAYEPYLRIAIRRQLSGPLRSKLDSRDVLHRSPPDKRATPNAASATLGRRERLRGAGRRTFGFF